MKDRFANVAVNIPVDRTFDYEIPERLWGKVRPGVIVYVPFGPRNIPGYCVGVSDSPEVENTKQIISIVEDEPVFEGRDIELARWIASEYAAGIGEVLEAMVPAAVRRGKARPAKEFARLTIPPEKALQAFEKGRKGAKQAAILNELVAAGGDADARELLEAAGASRSSLKSLEKAGLVELVKREVDPWKEMPPPDQAERFTLTPPQDEAVREIIESVVNRRFQGFLLLGVTGSGKTEVYIRAVEKVVEAGRQAIVLIPEIVLTPQTVARFVCRFKRVAVLHSNLSAGERHSQWRAIARGDAQVIIGARSAVFAPARNLGIIVIDEEHENSFKQDNAPRYHARDVALHRAKLGHFPVVLGSATPSLETFAKANDGLYRMLVLPERVEGRPLPKAEIVDMMEERAMRRGSFVLSRRLEQVVNTALARNEQVILFLNRRGFTTHLFCPRCGFVMKCDHCSISLIYHKRENLAVCHYCGHSTSVPDECPECHGGGVVHTGMGTERIEEMICAMYPEACVQRMDGDTMRRRHAHDDVYDRIRSGEIDILVGTQLLAKGHDFPNVTVVGVIGADTALHFPDFRARERTFQLLTQVAGRTGRSEKGGCVVIQTHCPDDPAIQFAAKHDYIGLARRELADRKALQYPPFVRLVRIVIDGEDEEKVASMGKRIVEALAPAVEEGKAKVLGPVPAPIARIKGRFRYHLVLKLPAGAEVAPVLQLLPQKTSRRSTVSVSIDVDPMNML